MRVAMMVTWYNPNDENINNIVEYLKFADKLYIVDNSSVNNKKLIKNSKKIEYIPNMKNLGIATALNIAANKAIGIENGPSHTEIKVTNDGPKIVELGARLGGDCITTHLVPLSTGMDMVKCIQPMQNMRSGIQIPEVRSMTCTWEEKRWYHGKENRAFPVKHTCCKTIIRSM